MRVYTEDLNESISDVLRFLVKRINMAVAIATMGGLALAQGVMGALGASSAANAQAQAQEIQQRNVNFQNHGTRWFRTVTLFVNTKLIWSETHRLNSRPTESEPCLNYILTRVSLIKRVN